MRAFGLRWLLLVPCSMCSCGDDGVAGETSTQGGTTMADSTSTTQSPPDASTTDSGSTSAAPGSSDTAAADTSTGASADDTSTGEGTTDATGTTGLADCNPLIVEVLYDAVDADDMLQWVKLYNPCAVDIDLDGWTLGWAGEDYGDPRRKALEGTVMAGGCWMVGGPLAAQGNGNPDFDLAEDFAPGLDTAQGVGGGVALFDLPLEMVDATTIPLDAVVYGPNNDNGLVDASGRAVDPPHVANPTPDSGSSIRRTSAAATWEIAAEPTWATCPPF